MSCLDSNKEVIFPTSSAQVCPSYHHSGWGTRDTDEAGTWDVRNIQVCGAELQDHVAKDTARCLLEIKILGLQLDVQNLGLGLPVMSQVICCCN